MGVIKSTAIRKAARGQDCTMQVVGVCNFNPETTIHAHFPSEIAGYKATDISGGQICSACHDWIDRRIPSDDSDREFYMRRSQVRTMTRLVDMGIITVKGAA